MTILSFDSSPVAYPPSSSPHRVSPRKRRKLENEGNREPLQPCKDDGNASRKSIAGFIIEDDSDDDGLHVGKSLECGRLLQSTLDQTGGSQNVENSFEWQQHDEGTPAAVEETKAYTTAQEADCDSVHQTFKKPFSHSSRVSLAACSTNHQTFSISRRAKESTEHYSSLVASRSSSTSAGAKISYYGIENHAVIDEARAKQKIEAAVAAAASTIPAVTQTIETAATGSGSSSRQVKTQLWTEKYRARKFTDLIGDERTHRSVLHWLKAWDPIVFPSSSRRSRPPTLKHSASSAFSTQSIDSGKEKPHPKLLLLAGPPGLGKTTLAHVCAKQAGYEVKEINASDERSRDVVKNRIRDMVGTENVRPAGKGDGKTAKPVCIVVDEVDGVTGGSSSANGEGGFVKALLDLLALDSRNSNKSETIAATAGMGRTKRKGDSFRLLRPIILICNDAYHPSLRLLRQSVHAQQNPAEIVHIRPPSLSLVIPRLQSIFTREGIPADADSVRQLCETTWNLPSHKERRSSAASSGASVEGDIRGILVVAEWVAQKFSNAVLSKACDQQRLTRKWLETNILQDLAQGGGAARGVSRGGAREAAERVFLYNAGYPAPPPPPSSTSTLPTQASLQNAQSADTGKHHILNRLRGMIESCDSDDRIVTDVFTAFPSHPYSDDTMLSKPNAAHDWLHFHDVLSHSVHTAQSWALAPYLSYPILAFHTLFASQKSSTLQHQSSNSNSKYASHESPQETHQHPLYTQHAPRIASEQQKQHSATLSDFHKTLSLPLQRSFRSPTDLATDLIPYLLRMLSPDVKPVIVCGSGGSSGEGKGVASVRRGEERLLVQRAVDAMVACGVAFEKARVQDDSDSFDTQHAPASKPWQTQQGSVYRMIPAIDDLAAFGTLASVTESTSKSTPDSSTVPTPTTTSTSISTPSPISQKTRYAVRQVLAQEHARELKRLSDASRCRRAGGAVLSAGAGAGGTAAFHLQDPADAPAAAVLNASDKGKGTKRDFFGRPIPSPPPQASASLPDTATTSLEIGEGDAGPMTATHARKKSLGKTGAGLPDGVKAITMKDLLEGY